MRVVAAVALMIGAIALSIAAVSAQTPEPTAEPSTTEEPPAASPTATSSDGDVLVIDVTIRIEASPEGRSQSIPDGTRFQVITGFEAPCVDRALSPDEITTLRDTRELHLGLITIPTEATDARCPEPGRPLSIVLAYPGGSYTVLHSSIWSPGAATAEFVIPVPIPPPSAQATASRLPDTGAGEALPVVAMYPMLVLLVSGGVALALGRRLRARPRR